MLTKIQSDNLARWIAALISGDYQQRFGSLSETHNGTRCHCATGVALEAFGFARFGNHFFFGFDADEISGLFSTLVVSHKWFAKTFGDEFLPKDISDMNDIDLQSFPQIACWLSHFLLDGAKKAQLQEIIMQKLDAEEAFQAEIRVAEANMLKLPEGLKATLIVADVERNFGKEV